ncbi:restriction endonuclease [Anoxybacillus sp. TBDG-1]
MESLNHRIKRKISKHIIKNFNDNKKELSQYLFDNCYSLVEDLKLNIEPEDIMFTIAYINNPDFQEFIKVLESEIKNTGGRSKINLLKNSFTYYIEKSTYGLSINNGLKRALEEKLNAIKRLQNGHRIYEKFCALFLQDFNFSNVYITTSSNDLGIDITGEYTFQSETSNPLLNILLPQNIVFLSQVKFYDSPVDTSYIRKLIGGSLFIRFDKDTHIHVRHNPVYLIFFSHSGFTEEAKRFAQENKICLIDSEFIVDLICSVTNSVELKSVNFLMNSHKV